MKIYIYKYFVFTLFACTVNSKAQVNLTSSLGACYSLNGNGNEPINSLTGTLTIATPTVDRFNTSGSALYFNGTSNCFVKCPDNPLIKPANAVSFSLWVKANSNGGANLIYTRNTLSSNFEAYQLGIYAGNPVFRLNKSSSQGNNIVISTTTVTPNTWYHIVGTIDNSNLKLYINGVLEGTTASTFLGFDYMAGREVILGNSNEFLTFPFHGTMDNLRFYNRTLNASEAAALYSQDPSCATVMAPPVASFSVSNISVCQGGILSFTDLSLNAPSSWLWQINGASTLSSTVSNPTFTFNLPGIYTVSLTATNGGGISANTATQSIVVLAKPAVTAQASSTLVCQGMQLTLTANGAGTYLWSNVMTGATIYVFPTASTIYTVTGTDANGCSSTASIQVIFDPNCITRLNENDHLIGVRIFPIPFNDELTIQSTEILGYKIIDSKGTLVDESKIPELDVLHLNTHELQKGLYLIRIETLHETFQKKIIKN